MDPELIYSLNVQAMTAAAPTLPRDVIRVATLFDGHRRLWEVIRDSALPSRMTMSVFTRLRQLGLLTDERPATGPGVAWAVATHQILPAMTKATARTRPTTPKVEAPPAPQPDCLVSVADAEALTIKIDRAVLADRAEPESPALTEARAEPSSAARPEPLRVVDADPNPQVEREAPTPAAAPAFDEMDEHFFDSYVPEDGSVDTFWDLEDTPMAQKRARDRAKRLQRGGWFKQLLSNLI
jgi:hypothetical protein